MWLDLFAAPYPDAATDRRIEAHRYGPIQALAIAGLPGEPMLNLILGAAEPGAAEHEHLASAAEWLDSLGVSHRVPVTPRLEGTGPAEDWLDRNGYERRWRLARYVREASPPELPEPPGIEVDDFADYGPDAEGFSEYALKAFGLSTGAGTLFEQLPRRRGWRCYAAIDERELGIGAATTFLCEGVAQLGFAATYERFRGRGVHLALLRRRIADATEAGCHTLFADVLEPLGEGEGFSPAARNLERAGFERALVRSVWEPAG